LARWRRSGPINARAADLPSAKSRRRRCSFPRLPGPGLYFGVSGGYAFDSSPNMNLEAYNSGVGTTFQPYAYAAGRDPLSSTTAPLSSARTSAANYQAGSWVLGIEASARSAGGRR